MKKFVVSLSVLMAIGVIGSLVLVGCKKANPNPNPNLTVHPNTPENLAIGTAIEGQYIVVFKDDALQAKTAALPFREAQVAVREKMNEILSKRNIPGEIEQTYAKVLNGVMLKVNADQINGLSSDPNIAYIEQDIVVGLSQKKGGKPGGGSTDPSQSTPWGITRVGGSGDGTGKVAWVIDSGIDLDHPDLNVDVARSATFLGGNSTPDDQNGHGTHVAGTIAAIDNTIGVVGVAANASVVSIRVLDRRGSGSLSGVIAGIDYVAANGAAGDVANMSLGGGVSTTLDNAVITAAQTGIKFALAAGNESDNVQNHSPARANGSNIYTVSAMNASDFWASFSNYGTGIDYCAPGVSINSTWKNGAYNTISGTSMATPHVAGLLLLGNIITSGYVSGDPDGNPDPIASH